MGLSKIRLSDEHLACFNFGNIMNNAVINMDVKGVCGLMFSFVSGK